MNKSEIHEVCRDWASGRYFPLAVAPERAVDDLRIMTRELPEAWWNGIALLLEKADSEEDLSDGLGFILRALILNGGDDAEASAKSRALNDPKWADLLYWATFNEEDESGTSVMFELLGRQLILTTYLRYLTQESDWDMWSDFVLDSLVNSKPSEALRAVVTLLEDARGDDGLIGVLAAGPLEDLIKLHAPTIVDEIEIEARRNESFRKALAGTWIWDIDPIVFERIEHAAGEVLAKPLPRGKRRPPRKTT